MERSRGSSLDQHEDELLYRVYLEISQDPIGSNNQSLGKLCEKIENSYNEQKYECWEIRSSRSLQGRMTTILYAYPSREFASKWGIVSIFIFYYTYMIVYMYFLRFHISCRWKKLRNC
ncbi:uncharacterized protein LOC117126549 [Brassica rapa]|uniref:uncharacterized protein LOC117126549 n=1 Tax=Brassica campestris TaxID=3711 RepID=UPI00142D3B4F|nr:uncharacterized protein LOC117126549 [Brassica rapa]